jgi:hypothetical protein
MKEKRKQKEMTWDEKKRNEKKCKKDNKDKRKCNKMIRMKGK